MHCPRCGQQQVSEEIKFCSRCGFPLGLVSEILAHGGFLPQLADLHKSKKWLTRKNGLKFTLIWFLVLTLFLPALFGLAGEEEAAGYFAVLGSLGGLILLVSTFLFLPKEQSIYPQQENVLPAPPRQAAQFAARIRRQALPPQMSQPVESYVPPANSWKAPDTGELVRPGSITEGTTKLLKKDE